MRTLPVLSEDISRSMSVFMNDIKAVSTSLNPVKANPRHHFSRMS